MPTDLAVLGSSFTRGEIFSTLNRVYFDIVNFQFLDGNIPHSTSYGVYNSQLIHFAGVSSHADDFNTRNKVLTTKLLKLGYKYKIFRKAFSKFYRHHFLLLSKYNVGLETLLLQGLPESEFYGDLVYKFRKILGKKHFLYHFNKIIVRYQKTGCTIDILRQTACLVVNPILLKFTALIACSRSSLRLNDHSSLNPT